MKCVQTRLALISLAAIISLAQAANSQSGRRHTPSPKPSPHPTRETSVSPGKPIRPTLRPKSIIITGKAVIDEGGYYSRDVKIATDEIVFMFDLFRFPTKPVRGGTMTKQQAIDRAKAETDALVLWLGINVKNDIYSVEGVVLERVDYILFLPRTGEVLHQGQIDPNNIVQLNEHGVRTPPMTRGRTKMIKPQLRACARQIARIVRGWL